ncbi:hypothetical protein GCM10007852_24950 [Agaribacter marinus]|uniref:Uncharacterized protein n=1 Tax=Agaribacter marinus TaxID=1431249 RepID=A0AA37SYL2_9ALTE|nr:hypothetical protein GCM10007852_24950 [Agaribacter marinus]
MNNWWNPRPTNSSKKTKPTVAPDTNGIVLCTPKFIAEAKVIRFTGPGETDIDIEYKHIAINKDMAVTTFSTIEFFAVAKLST